VGNKYTQRQKTSKEARFLSVEVKPQGNKKAADLPVPIKKDESLCLIIT